jgi:hypothetical protein
LFAGLSSVWLYAPCHAMSRRTPGAEAQVASSRRIGQERSLLGTSAQLRPHRLRTEHPCSACATSSSDEPHDELTTGSSRYVGERDLVVGFLRAVHSEQRRCGRPAAQRAEPVKTTAARTAGVRVRVMVMVMVMVGDLPAVRLSEAELGRLVSNIRPLRGWRVGRRVDASAGDHACARSRRPY